jgi:cytochrome c-type biogenesis protein CcmH/NrfF
MTPARLDRRRFLGGALALVPVLRTPQDSSVARLQQPDLAGRPRRRVTDYENDPFIIGIERQLRCTCGCGLDIYVCRTTDFTCTYSPELHREVVALVEQGKTAEEILAAFVDKYGEKALMAPPAKGFNWAGYLLPGIAIVLVGVVLGWVLLRRARTRAPAPVPAGTGAGAPGLTSDEDARLREELARLES